MKQSKPQKNAAPKPAAKPQVKKPQTDKKK